MAMKPGKKMEPMMAPPAEMQRMMQMMHGGKMASAAPKMPAPMPAKKMPPRGMLEKQHAPQKRK